MRCSRISAADSLEKGSGVVIMQPRVSDVMKKNGPDKVALVLN